ncbi:MBL fold metallo-hydrolase RNA specificity domain-containing protein [Thermodesulfobacterium hydrogeniphilum]|uniref:MBL fold metallo-hydrolase RNA specificity domain-containing protein n=1 Tax=Thermodesulfobacterium hydrogeniphilum TaxID=161156 RepID=UPI000AE85C6F|nr:MBL fold metallo-hydrolase [Thermodesulfobacterium hydrogeniphilum]
MDISIGFYGATQFVTGSCFLLNIRGTKILIDCGMFQGLEHDKNYIKFPFDPKDISYLILTHSHVDHCGRIPLLVRKGFKGKIICTKPTSQIAKIMLLDAAKVMREHYKTLYRKSLRKGLDLPPPPLYDEYDVVESFNYFKILVAYDTPLLLENNIKITFKDAGHILGSAFVEIEDLEIHKKIIFSGDLGNKNRPIIRDFAYPSSTDFLCIETTYGDRNHKSFEESKQELLEAILDTFDRGGNVLIPSFALERAQEIIYILREFYEEGKLPRCHVFLDSPLAIKATRIFKDNPEFYDEETFHIFVKKDPFDFPYLIFTEDVEESKGINNVKSGAIIIAGNGMLTGGRILHHLKNNLWRPECSLVFVGFQPKGTLGRHIVDGAQKVHIFGEEIPVRTKVYTINGFSSHAGQNELLEWISHVDKVKKLFLIHGEREKMEIFKKVLEEKFKNKFEEIYIPSFEEEITLA